MKQDALEQIKYFLKRVTEEPVTVLANFTNVLMKMLALGQRIIAQQLENVSKDIEEICAKAASITIIEVAKIIV